MHFICLPNIHKINLYLKEKMNVILRNSYFSSISIMHFCSYAIVFMHEVAVSNPF